MSIEFFVNGLSQIVKYASQYTFVQRQNRNYCWLSTLKTVAYYAYVATPETPTLKALVIGGRVLGVVSCLGVAVELEREQEREAALAWGVTALLPGINLLGVLALMGKHVFGGEISGKIRISRK